MKLDFDLICINEAKTKKIDDFNEPNKTDKYNKIAKVATD